MSSRSELERYVASRAEDRCEYCRMHQALQGGTFHLEHIVPTSRGGETTLENLAWACPSCNLRKSNRIEVEDPMDGGIAPLFNPRRSLWSEHFAWDDYQVIGLSATGRASVAALSMNDKRRLLIRQAEQTFGLFPPED